MKRHTTLITVVSIAVIASLPIPASRAQSSPAVRCANLIYAGTKSSVCFSDRFLKRLAEETRIRCSQTFDRFPLAKAKELIRYPFAIISGEGAFEFTTTERENFKKFVHAGGFVLASAGCSDARWAASFRKEFERIWPGARLSELPANHPSMNMIYSIRTLETLERKRSAKLLAYFIGKRLAIVFSSDGLNDSRHAVNCCCCGGDEIANAEFINLNLLAYAVLH